MGRRAAAVAIATVLVLAGCSDDEPSEARQRAIPGELLPELEFGAEAATLCTEIVNEAVVGPDLPSPDAVYVDVLGAIADGREPSAASRATWAALLTDHLAAAATSKERLAAIVPTDTERELWTRVVNSYDATVQVLERRAEALTGGSWVQVRVAFGERIDSSDVMVALNGIGLGLGDCANVFTPELVQPPEQWRDFTAAAATVCTEIANRRALSGERVDPERVVFAEDQVADGEVVTSPDDVDDALGRIAAEWRSTADDFATIEAADSPSPGTWEALGELAGERVSMAEQRRAALATRNAEAMTAAFARPDYRLRSFGFELLLLEGRSCGGLRA